jgi:glycerol-1-phosphate dehydrogenase [NAD(P)+]
MLTAVLGVGGGKVIDVAKMASTQSWSAFCKHPYSCFHIDGIASPRASIKNKKGSVSLAVEPPVGVMLILRSSDQAPFRF